MNLIYPNIALFITIIVATVIVAYIVKKFFHRLIQKNSFLLTSDPTNYKFLSHVSSAVIYIIGFSIAIYMIPSLRALASSMLAGAGIVAVAVGFASQHALSNIISGVFIVIFKPFRVNDRLVVRGMTGIVEDITLRHTVIRDFENKRILIPNTVISDEIIINSDFTEDKICKWVDMSIGFDADLDLAKKIMQEEVMAHPLHVDPRTPEEKENNNPEVIVRVLMITENAVNLRAWAWAKNASDAFVLNCDILESTKKRFDQEGIEIPHPYRTIIYKERKGEGKDFSHSPLDS